MGKQVGGGGGGGAEAIHVHINMLGRSYWGYLMLSYDGLMICIYIFNINMMSS